MTPDAIERAAAMLVQARRTGVLLDGLPEDCRPRTLDEAHDIQAAALRLLGERAAGWKVGARFEGGVVRGAILPSRVIQSGGSIAASSVPLLGVEAEVAFRFDRAMPPRDEPYTYEDVVAAVTAFPAIEIVDSRFRDYRGTPLIQRIADFVSNGAFVEGRPERQGGELDLAALDARIELDGQVAVRRTTGHPAGDPLLPAVDLVNDLRESSGVARGQVMTTGTYTALTFARPGQRVTAVLDGFGRVEVLLAN